MTIFWCSEGDWPGNEGDLILSALSRGEKVTFSGGGSYARARIERTLRASGS